MGSLENSKPPDHRQPAGQADPDQCRRGSHRAGLESGGHLQRQGPCAGGSGPAASPASSPGNGPASTFRCNPMAPCSRSGCGRPCWKFPAARPLPMAAWPASWSRRLGRSGARAAQSAADRHSVPSRRGWSGKGGYSGLGGLTTKDWLLNHEMAMVAEPAT